MVVIISASMVPPMCQLYNSVKLNILIGLIMFIYHVITQHVVNCLLQTMCHHVLSCHIQSYHIMPCLIMSYHVMSLYILEEITHKWFSCKTIFSCQVKSCLVMSATDITRRKCKSSGELRRCQTCVVFQSKTIRN